MHVLRLFKETYAFGTLCNLVNISFEAGMTPLSTESIYSAPKAAINAFAAALSKKFSDRNICANSILIGIVNPEGHTVRRYQ